MRRGGRGPMRRALQDTEGVAVIGPGGPLPEGTHDTSVWPFLVVRLGASPDRAQVPPQRTHAGIVFSVLTDLLEQFGPKANAALARPIAAA